MIQLPLCRSIQPSKLQWGWIWTLLIESLSCCRMVAAEQPGILIALDVQDRGRLRGMSLNLLTNTGESF